MSLPTEEWDPVSLPAEEWDPGVSTDVITSLWVRFGRDTVSTTVIVVSVLDSGSTVSEYTVSKDTVSEGTVSEYTVSEYTVRTLGPSEEVRPVYYCVT